MFVVKLCFSLLFFINSIFLYALELPKHSSNNNRNTNPYVIAIMVEFEQDNSPFTSGDGLFLDSLNIQMVSDSSLDRCNQFILDRPPHNVNYFSSQIEAVSNYYKSASNDNLNIQSQIILNPNNEKGYYRLNKIMESYSYSDRDLSALFKESLELAKEDIELYLESNPDINFEDIIFTVFHAGIGQDFSFPTFDPTVYDIKSAYLEPEMFDGLSFPIINNNQVSSGILLPETQNMIFFSSVEDIFYGEDSYCDYQLGMTGTFSFLMGYALGLPPLFNTETGDPGIGIFGLMDVAENLGFEQHNEDFGQTLAVWGFGEGPYLMLPILGPSNPRDAIGKVVDFFVDPINWWVAPDDNRIPIIRTAVTAIDLRDRLWDNLEEIDKNSIDPYASYRSMYRQRRNDEIRNGSNSQSKTDLEPTKPTYELAEPSLTE